MRITHIIYRYITQADFFNIYKPPKVETGGGGQSYIDLRRRQIDEADWREFLAAVDGVNEEKRKQGPSWTFPVRNIGVIEKSPQRLTVYQRRPASFSLAGQKLHTEASNRLRAWHPDHGFPAPEDPLNREQAPENLLIFLAKTDNNQIYAGWIIHDGYHQNRFLLDNTDLSLDQILPAEHEEGQCGLIRLDTEDVRLDLPTESQLQQTAQAKKSPDTENDLDFYFEHDTAPQQEGSATTYERVVSIRNRNKKMVAALKGLYKGQCQVTGDRLTFRKSDGTLYSEAHHLIPLNEDGADDPHNVVIISPLIHRMLHYGTVEGLDLRNIQKNEDGSAYLTFRINGEPYKIYWHPKHAKFFEDN